MKTPEECFQEAIQDRIDSLKKHNLEHCIDRKVEAIYFINIPRLVQSKEERAEIYINAFGMYKKDVNISCHIWEHRLVILFSELIPLVEMWAIRYLCNDLYTQNEAGLLELKDYEDEYPLMRFKKWLSEQTP